MEDLLRIRTALLSVTDKTDLLPLAQALLEKDVRLISTGGTAKALRDAGLPVLSVESITGNPEAFGGRMKSISFQIASGLLFRRGDAQDEEEAQRLNIPRIDLVVCNLYEFEKHVGKKIEENVLVEEIDIGGPLMIRAAAKNYHGVAVLSNPKDYRGFVSHLQENGGVEFSYRRELASKAFDKIARYDIAIAEELGGRFQRERSEKYLAVEKVQDLRYGENPHQKAAWYKWPNAMGFGLESAKILQGKELSYNNLLDADAAWKCMSDVKSVFAAGFTAVVVKHGNPCGLAHGSDPLQALHEAWKGDDVSAFGGIIALSFPVDQKVAEFFSDKFIEVLMAPSFSEEAKLQLAKKKNVRALQLPVRLREIHEQTARSITGGLLLQDEDEKLTSPANFIPVTQKTFDESFMKLASFGVVACKHLKSNGIALVGHSHGAMVLFGTGMGQPNRLDSLQRLAVPRAEEKGVEFGKLVLISDAFFPFSDSIEAAHDCGLRYIVQPGGSIRDEEVIQKADDFGMAMVFTGERHFRH